MAIESTITSVTILGNGAARNWPFPFKAWKSQIAVFVAAPNDAITDVTASAGIVINNG
jgi:hypothetical protein